MLPLAFSPHPYGCACFLWRIPVRTNLLSHISYFLIQRRCIKESSSFSNIRRRRFSQSFLSFPFLFKWQLCTLEFYCPNLGIKQLPNHAFFHWKFQLITTTFLHWKSLSSTTMVLFWNSTSKFQLLSYWNPHWSFEFSAIKISIT